MWKIISSVRYTSSRAEFRTNIVIKPCRKMWSILKRYLANCNVHGIRYIVEDSFHWTERLFWLAICALSWFGCGTMVQDAIEGFYYRPVAFTSETTYLKWATDFPSISICIRAHPEARLNASSAYQKMYGTTIRFSNAWSFLFSSSTSRTDRVTAAQLSKLTSDDIVHLYNETTAGCTRLMNECFWRSMKFNCCDEFKPLRTATGLCYVFNSKQTGADTSSNTFVMDQSTGPGYLSIGLADFCFKGEATYIQVSIHNNLEMPTSTLNTENDITVAADKVSIVYFNLQDTFNEPGLKHIPPKRRGCRFSDETDNFVTYKWYSNDGCSIQLEMENMLRICGCVNHLFPYATGDPVCNYTSKKCLDDNRLAIMAKDDMGKRCLPDCEGTVIRRYENLKVIHSETSVLRIAQGIHLELLALPTSRYRRYVVRSLLDLVVAVGSTAGLFMGAGILSLVEIPYWLLLRHSS